MTMLLIMATALAVSFLVYVCVSTKGIPSSVSASYYELGSDGWFFELVMVCVPLMLFPVWLEHSEVENDWMVFLSCSGLAFVGVSPAFRLPVEGFVHYSSAIVCGTCAVLWQVIEGLYDVTILFGFVGGMLALMWRDNWMWWLECAIIGSLFANLWR